MAVRLCTRPRSCQFGLVRLENLAVRHSASVYVHFGLHLGLYAQKTWLYAPARVCTSPFVPAGSQNMALRPVLSEHVPFLARLGLCTLKTWLYAAGRVCMFPLQPIWASTPRKPGCTPCACVPFVACTPRKPGYTPHFGYARARYSPFVAVCLENLAVCPWASVYVPFGAHMGLYARET